MKTTLENSLEYITQKTQKKTGFSTPTHYFENVENSIFKQLTSDKILKEKNFTVPAHYFENLEDRILEKIITDKKPTKVVTLQKKILKIIPFMAAASVVLFISFYAYQHSKKEISLDTIADADIETWFSNGFETIESTNYDFLLEEADFNEDDDIDTEILNKDDVEKYINNEDITPYINEF